MPICEVTGVSFHASRKKKSLSNYKKIASSAFLLYIYCNGISFPKMLDWFSQLLEVCIGNVFQESFRMQTKYEMYNLFNANVF